MKLNLPLYVNSWSQLFLWFIALICTAACSAERGNVQDRLSEVISACGDRFVDVIIVGGGPAGLAAGRKVVSLRRSAVIFMGDVPGGQLIGSVLVDNVPGVPGQPGWQLIESEEACIKKSETVHIEYDIVVDLAIDRSSGKKLFIVTTKEGDAWCAPAIILATGGTAKFLEVPGEADYVNKSIFTCASCDGSLARGNVFVVGGGDASIDALMTLLNYVPHCTLLVRKHALRASAALQERIRHNGHITIRYGVEVVEVKGDGERMHQLLLKTDHGFELVDADYLFLSIGHRPTTDYPWLRLLVACDRQGYIGVDCHQQTSCAGIFAAGEVAMPFVEEHQLVYVYGTSTRAAKQALDYCDRWYEEIPGLKESLAPRLYQRQRRLSGLQTAPNQYDPLY